MQCIQILGPCGSGKSTLASQLAKQIKLPLIHLDQQFFAPNWVEMPLEQWKDLNHELAAKPQWIIDGNYGGTIDIRLAKADTIIYLDRPTWLCFWRVVKRIWINYGQVRPDMAEACKERVDWMFLHYVVFFNWHKRSKILAKLDALKGEKQVIILKNESEIHQFLRRI